MIMAPVGELMYYFSSPKCTPNASIGILKFKKCYPIENPDLRPFSDFFPILWPIQPTGTNMAAESSAVARGGLHQGG